MQEAVTSSGGAGEENCKETRPRSEVSGEDVDMGAGLGFGAPVSLGFPSL